jgi:hypothetical protein
LGIANISVPLSLKKPKLGAEAQIKAAEKFGSHGWMLWNPRNSYSANGLKRDEPEKVALQTETK